MTEGLPRPVSTEDALAYAGRLDDLCNAEWILKRLTDGANALRTLVSERDALAVRVRELEAAAVEAAQPEAARPVDATAIEWKDAVWRAYMVLRRNDNTIPSEWLEFMKAKLLASAPTIQPTQPAQEREAQEYRGWYCAHCQRGVDGSDVTFREQHIDCGRVITNDRPPATAAQVDGEAYRVLLACDAVCERIITQDGGILGGVDFHALRKGIRAALSANPPAQPEAVGEVESIDTDEDGQHSAWVSLHQKVNLGQHLYAAPNMQPTQPASEPVAWAWRARNPKTGEPVGPFIPCTEEGAKRAGECGYEVRQINAQQPHPDTVRLDAIQERRIALIPEYEGPWDAQVYGDEGEPSVIGTGNTPRAAIDAAMSATKGGKL